MNKKLFDSLKSVLKKNSVKLDSKENKKTKSENKNTRKKKKVFFDIEYNYSPNHGYDE